MQRHLRGLHDLEIDDRRILHPGDLDFDARDVHHELDDTVAVASDEITLADTGGRIVCVALFRVRCHDLLAPIACIAVIAKIAQRYHSNNSVALSAGLCRGIYLGFIHFGLLRAMRRVTVSARNVLLISGLAVALAAPVSAMADEDCCPSGGNGVAPRSPSVLAGAPPVDCCPSGGNGLTGSSTGFGQSSPNLLNLSSDPQWRAYAFTKDGVRYMQINDGAGHVRAGFATAGGVLMVLPMGSDQVFEVDSLPAGGRAIYQDGFMAIMPQLLPDGSVQWLVVFARA